MDEMKKGGLFDGASSEWNESDHPRDEDGKFADKGVELSMQKAEIIKEDISTLLGTEFSGVKGQAAVAKLMKEKQGHIKGAFTREDIGDIDLLWGSDSVGLKHIINRRQEQGINIDKFIQDIAEVIEQGTFHKKSERGDFEFWKSGKMVVIAPEYHGNKITYLLTAYKRTKNKNTTIK